MFYVLFTEKYMFQYYVLICARYQLNRYLSDYDVTHVNKERNNYVHLRKQI